MNSISCYKRQCNIIARIRSRVQVKTKWHEFEDKVFWSISGYASGKINSDEPLKLSKEMNKVSNYKVFTLFTEVFEDTRDILSLFDDNYNGHQNYRKGVEGRLFPVEFLDKNKS